MTPKHRTLDILKVLDYIIVFLLILGTHSIFSVSTSPDYPILLLTVIGIGVRLLLSISYFRKLKVSMLILIMSWITYIMTYEMISPGETRNLIQKFVILFILLILYFYLLIDTKKLGSIFAAYSNIMLVIATISIFFWVLGSLLDILQPTSLVDFYWGKERISNSYYNIYVEWQNDFQLFGKVIFRNIGIFTEAPMFSLNLSVAFLFDYFILNRRGSSRIFLYAITFLSSVSITGILLFGMSLVLEPVINTFLSVFLRGKIKPYMLVVPLLMILALIVTMLLFTNKLSSASGSSRIEDYIVGYKAWKENPIFGSGYGNTDIRKQFMSRIRLRRAEDGFTNSPMTVLTEGGIYFFSSYLFAFIYLIKLSLRRKNIRLFIFVSMWVFLFTTTTFEHTSLMVSFIALSFTLWSRKGELEISID